MRIPLVRRKGDETPDSWWEWLFLPILFVFGVLFCISFIVISIPWTLIAIILMLRQRVKLVSRMKKAGRYVSWSIVKEALLESEGTLLVEHVSPNGPVRDWWTADDLITPLPSCVPSSCKISLDASDSAIITEFAETSVARYLSDDNASAKMTCIPVRWSEITSYVGSTLVEMPDDIQWISFPCGRRLGQRFPKAKILTYLPWLSTSKLARGDAESFFLGSCDSTVRS